jgi:hypothetical protein
MFAKYYMTFKPIKAKEATNWWAKSYGMKIWFKYKEMAIGLP